MVDSGITAVVAQGGVQVVLTTMKAYSEAQDVATSACRALRGLLGSGTLRDVYVLHVHVRGVECR